MVNLDELLRPVTAEAPGGPNLEYSPEFAELERTALGKPERQVGATIVPAEDPDWRGMIAQSTALLASTKDLRVANHLVIALLRVDGFAGLAEGLKILCELVGTYWSSLHPLFDPADDNDPTLRANAMAALTHRDTLQAIRATPLFQLKAFGAVTLREIEAGAPTNGQPSPQTANLEAAFEQVALEELTRAANTVKACVDESKRLADDWGEKIEGAGPDFAEFRRLLAHASHALATHVARRQPSHTEGENGQPMADSAPDERGTFAGGVPRSRDDVVRALDAICAYYARHEPSSPVPLLLDRCKRLVTMSFVDIVKDMLPDGMSTIRTLTGKRDM